MGGRSAWASHSQHHPAAALGNLPHDDRTSRPAADAPVAIALSDHTGILAIRRWRHRGRDHGHLSTIMRRGFYPIIIVSQVIPKISIAPLFIVWFGTGTVSELLLAFLISFFPMTINSALGFQSFDRDIELMARTFMGSDWQIFWKIRMPNALPYIFGGMKI